MKRVILSLLAIVVVIFVLDFSFGAIMRTIERHSDDKNTYCSTNFNDDILILGSSASVHDLCPDIFEKELGMTCYCAGEGGNGVFVAWARYNMCIRHHRPKIIIYCDTPEYDYLQQNGENYAHNLDILQNYYNRDSVVNEMFKEFKPYAELLKLNFNFVRYNSTWLKTIVHIASSTRQYHKGHYPFRGKFKPFDKKPDKERGPYPVDSVKLKYLTKLFSDIHQRDIMLVCVIPPTYYDTYDSEKYASVFNLCKKLNVPVIDNHNVPQITGKASLFYDSVHLNEEGASEYTDILCGDIKNLIQ